MKTQEELKDLYMQIIKTEVWHTEDMQEFARKRCGNLVELSNGKIIWFEKPYIKTRFCFGYGQNGRSTDEEEDFASDLSQEAKENFDRFIGANLEEINWKIKQLEETLESIQRQVWIMVEYYGQPDNSRLVGYTVVNVCDSPECSPEDYRNSKGLQKLGEEDIRIILGGLEEQKRLFLKRLNTYLKKYGLSKVDTWTYLRD